MAELKRQINGSGEEEYCVDLQLRRTARNQNLFSPLTQTHGVTMGTFLHCSDCKPSGVKRACKIGQHGGAQPPLEMLIKRRCGAGKQVNKQRA